MTDSSGRDRSIARPRVSRGAPQANPKPEDDAGDSLPPVLYHCIPAAPHGDAIAPGLRYGAKIPPSVREALNMGEGKEPLLFAATHLTKALAFGMKETRQGLLNLSIPGGDNEIHVTCGRELALSMPLNATIYAFSSAGFVRLPDAERQAVSLKPVPFEQSEVVLKAGCARDLMRAGLQIFSLRETAAEFNRGEPAGGNALISMWKQSGEQDLFDFIIGLARSGALLWENEAAGVNPDPTLAGLLRDGGTARPSRPSPGRINKRCKM